MSNHATTCATELLRDACANAVRELGPPEILLAVLQDLEFEIGVVRRTTGVGA